MNRSWDDQKPGIPGNEANTEKFYNPESGEKPGRKEEGRRKRIKEGRNTSVFSSFPVLRSSAIPSEMHLSTQPPFLIQNL